MRPLGALLIGLGALGAAVTLTVRSPSEASATMPSAAARFCSLIPGRVLALVRVERDTTLPFATASPGALTSSGVPPGALDSILAAPGTPMPAARVRLLKLDSTTRDAFVRAGITGDQPTAFLRAAPYGADCRTVRWRDTAPWVQRGDVGYVRATLAPREQWVGGVPVLVIPEVWAYPYPRRRGLVVLDSAPRGAAIASADALYTLHAALEVPHASGDVPNATPEIAAARLDSARRDRALRWIRSHAAESELEPARSIAERAVLAADWREAERAPSRLRGTYRVTMEGEGVRGSWYFRTHERPGYRWLGADGARTAAALLASPYTAGYLLVGRTALTRDALPSTESFSGRVPLVWLASEDRPTAPGNSARRVLRGRLEFTLGAAPEALWDQLDAFVPPRSVEDSVTLARMRYAFARAEQQPRLPITLRLDGNAVRADTTLIARGRSLHLTLERLDTLSTRRPF